jgi:hypothetical protein
LGGLIKITFGKEKKEEKKRLAVAFDFFSALCEKRNPPSYTEGHIFCNKGSFTFDGYRLEDEPQIGKKTRTSPQKT